MAKIASCITHTVNDQGGNCPGNQVKVREFKQLSKKESFIIH